MKKVTGLHSEGVEMREYYTLNGKEYDTLADVLKVMKPNDAAEARRTIYLPSGDKDTSLGGRSYASMWRTYAVVSISDMGLTLRSATAESVNELPLAKRYKGDLSELVFTF